MSPCLLVRLSVYLDWQPVLADNEELTVATEDDKQAVLDITKNDYPGYDYLPSLFSHFVSGPGVTAFLFKINGELVRFLFIYFFLYFFPFFFLLF